MLSFQIKTHLSSQNSVSSRNKDIATKPGLELEPDKTVTPLNRMASYKVRIQGQSSNFNGGLAKNGRIADLLCALDERQRYADSCR
ncbi:hypothetical protein [Celeribacter sp. HF31]|uniref:hypothetical protein n=1 Tax=Celeribacter sp. HF31 TaxID=2721558 RepID=UPI001431BB5C|nr:hypothetical protein [Celeribacter sp. HF31]